MKRRLTLLGLMLLFASVLLITRETGVLEHAGYEDPDPLDQTIVEEANLSSPRESDNAPAVAVHDRIDPRLQALLTEVERLPVDADPRLLSTGFQRVDENRRIQIYIHTSDLSTFHALRRAYESDVEIFEEGLGILQVWFTVDQLRSVVRQPGVSRVSLPSYAAAPNPNADRSFLDEDISPSRYTGKGVRIGVISDGVNHRSSAPLPQNITVFGSCQPRSFDGSRGIFGNTCNEGTAMLELIHERAPDAELGFGAVATSMEFVTRVRQLTEEFGADIIVDDLGFFLEPYFEEGVLARGIKPYLDRVVYLSSAGNQGLTHYSDTFELSPEPVSGLFSPHQFNDEGDSDLLVQVDGRGLVYVVLQWSDPFGGAVNDYDIHLLEGDGSRACPDCLSTDRQGAGRDPLEYLVYYNESLIPRQVRLVINRWNGAARELKVLIYGHVRNMEYRTLEGSIFGHAALEKVLAVGVEKGYSSRGPYTQRQPTLLIRDKPDLLGRDGYEVSGAGGFPTEFYGTSAAAPPLAALAAEILERDPSLTPAEVRESMRTARRSGVAQTGIHGFETRSDEEVLANAFPEEDWDNDGIPNGEDHFPLNAADRYDADGDGYPDRKEYDADGDELIDSGDPNPLEYTVVGDIEPNDERVNAAYVGREGKLSSINDVDWYYFETEFPTDLRVRLRASRREEDHFSVSVFDEPGAELLTVDVYGDDTFWVSLPERGRYYLRLSGNGELSGESYVMEATRLVADSAIRWEKEVNDDLESAEPPVAMGTINRASSPQRYFGQLSTPDDVDIYQVTVSSPSQIEIGVSTGGDEVQVTLEDDTGRVIVADKLRWRADKAGAIVPETGTYYLRLQSPEGGHSRKVYELSVNDFELIVNEDFGVYEREPNDRQSLAADLRTSELSLEVRGTLSFLDTADWYTFDVLESVSAKFFFGFRGTDRTDVEMLILNENLEVARFTTDYSLGELVELPAGQIYVRLKPLSTDFGSVDYRFGVSCQDGYRCLDFDGDGIANDIDPDPRSGSTDRDGDGIENRRDQCPDVPDGSVDNDGDGLGDNCDQDDDADGMPDDYELSNGLDPLINDAEEDLDGDGSPNIEEFRLMTDPQDAQDNACISVSSSRPEDSELPYEARVNLFAARHHPERQSVLRLMTNGSRRIPVEIYGIDEKGNLGASGPYRFSLSNAVQINSDELASPERANSGAVCLRTENARLVIRAGAPIFVQSFLRTEEGFVANVHDSADSISGGLTLDYLNPASNSDRKSVLRLVNHSPVSGEIEISGIDDRGQRSGSVVISIEPNASVEVPVEVLEGGSDQTGVVGSIDDGTGKWRLELRSDLDFSALSLLQSRDGSLSNLTQSQSIDGSVVTMMRRDVEGTHFLRLINRSDEVNNFILSARDQYGQPAAIGDVTLSLSPGESRQMTTRDLERGNTAKGLAGRWGEGSGAWAVTISASKSAGFMNLLRLNDGFLSNMTGTVADLDSTNRQVDFVNPASNTNQTSILLVRNETDRADWVTVRSSDDRGRLEVTTLHLWEHEIVELSSEQLEEGDETLGMDGLGLGTGKRRITLEAYIDVEAQSLLRTPAGRVNNMSSVIEAQRVD